MPSEAETLEHIDSDFKTSLISTLKEAMKQGTRTEKRTIKRVKV